MVNRIISTNRFSRKIEISPTKRNLFAGFMSVGIFFLLIFLCMALLNTWYNSDTTKLAFKIETLKQQEELLKDELIKLNIEVERLTSPERMREEIAPKLNMVLPESGPVKLKKRF